MQGEARTLDAEIAVPRKKTARRSAALRRKETRPQVLLADDSDAVRLLTAALLKRIGCDVDAVEHGEAALGLARHVRYDLILLDLDMPFMDGMTTAREIRRLSSNSGTPITAVSAFLEGIGDPGERRRLFDGELAKPVSSEQLRRVLVDAWPTASASENGPQEGDYHLPLVDRGIVNANVLRAGPESSIRALEVAIAEMRACAARLELAIARNDGEPLKRAAYMLSRLALSCGASRLARRANGLLMLANVTPADELRHHITQVLGCVAATVVELTEIVNEH